MKYLEILGWAVMLIIISSVGMYFLDMNRFESVLYAFVASIAYDIHCMKGK